MGFFIDGVPKSDHWVDRVRMKIGRELVSYGFNLAPEGLWRAFIHQMRIGRDEAGPRAVPVTDTGDFAAAVEEFERLLPDWFFCCGACSVSRHASCGPDRHGRDGDLLKIKSTIFDRGFHADLANGTMADALRHVMRQGLAAKRAYEAGRLSAYEEEITKQTGCAG